MLWLKTKQTIP